MTPIRIPSACQYRETWSWCYERVRILILGVAHKKNIDDDRESPSYKLMELLTERGAEIRYNDPHIPILRPTRKYNFGLSSTPITEENLHQIDCILIATNHDAYDYDFILRHASLIVDTKNVFAHRSEYPDKIYMA